MKNQTTTTPRWQCRLLPHLTTKTHNFNTRVATRLNSSAYQASSLCCTNIRCSMLLTSWCTHTPTRTCSSERVQFPSSKEVPIPVIVLHDRYDSRALHFSQHSWITRRITRPFLRSAECRSSIFSFFRFSFNVYVALLCCPARHSYCRQRVSRHHMGF